MAGCAFAALIMSSWVAAMATAPAAELPRKPRRVGDDNFADMDILLAVFVPHLKMLNAAP